MQLVISIESANALRRLASAMPLAVKNMLESTLKLYSVYRSVSETLGVHNQDFHDMLMHIRRAQECSAEALEALPPMMNETADKIEQYVVKHPVIRTSAGNPSGVSLSEAAAGEKTARVEYHPIDYVQYDQNGEAVELRYDQPVVVDSDAVSAVPERILSFFDQKLAQSWAETEFRAWRNGLSQKEEDCIRMYSGAAYDAINQQNRYLTRETEEIEAISGTIEKALSRSQLPHDMIVYRGLSEEAVLDMARHTDGTLQSGTILNEMAFLSTSMTPDTRFCRDASCIMRLIAVEGLHGAPLIYGDLASVSHENEMLFSRNLGIEIQSVARCPRSDLVPGAGDDPILVIDGILSLY